MSLNATPSPNRTHIGFFGKRNAGKSSLVNAVTGQELAVVSEVKGTTTDPVQKAMELLPLGPVVVIDTPGIDDEGALGELRVKKTRQVLNKTDVAVLVADGTGAISGAERELLGMFREKGIPFAIAINKADLQEKDEKDMPAKEGLQETEEKSIDVKEGLQETEGESFTVKEGLQETKEKAGSVKGNLQEIDINAFAAKCRRWKELENCPQCISVSAATGYQIRELKEKIAALAAQEEPPRRLVGDLLQPGDSVVLVVPIDKAAPKGRLILPQQQTIRDILDSDAVSIVVKENSLKETLRQFAHPPAMVITDSQVFAKVSADTPPEIPLTSFSILFARQKGDLQAAVQGAAAIGNLQDGDKILISEGCTHHRQCGDIGSEKLPRWLKEHTQKELRITLTSGTEFPENLSGYKLIIHCGGCMLNSREMKYRLTCAQNQGVPMTNYGIAIAYMKGILARSIEVFPDIVFHA